MSNVYEQQLTSITSSDTPSSSNIIYSTSSIKRLLLNDDIHFKVLSNNSKRTTAACWKSFGFPAEFNKDDLTKFKIIPGFVSCKSCFDTYKYIDSSTANLYNHRCYREDSSDQMSITSFIRSPRSTANSSKMLKKKDEFKKLCVRWIASSMRPFQIVADPGLLRIVQAALDIGKECRSDVDICAENILPSDRTVKNELVKMAADIRNKLTDILVKAAQNKSLSISPDNWTDNHRRITYMGATAHFIDDSQHYQSIDLFCVEFRETKKTAENIYSLMENQLAYFGLNNYMDDIVYVTDRGSNFVKAFQSHKVLFCVAHRLNNVLKRCFYQNPVKKPNSSSNKPSQPDIPETPTKQKASPTHCAEASPEVEDEIEIVPEDEL